MPQLNLTSILIPFGALLLGWVIGFLDSNLRTSKKIKEAENKAEVAIKEAEEKVAEAEARLASFSEPVSDNAGVLRLKDEQGTLTLELDGQKVDTLALSPDQKKRLINILGLMRPWLERGPAPVQTPRPAATPQLAPMPVTNVRQGSTPIMPALVPEPKLDTKKTPPPPLSIVEQIDSILQLRMMDTSLAQRDIRLQESREGEVEVFVGNNKYSSIDEVPDDDVKSAIRAAIAEWERKYTPGL